MIKYFKTSFAKLKQDALSKALYDILKGIIVILLVSIFAKIIPNETSIGSIINYNFNFSVLNFGIVIFFTISITLFLTILYSRKKYKELKNDNFTDELTGMLNEKAIRELLPETIESCKKQKLKLSLIIIDVDDFKKFNDDYDYKTADKVLGRIGEILKSDNRATDISFRQYFKGDEFIILAKETELSNAIKAANRKKNLFKTGIEVNGETYRITVSCGVTEYNFNSDDQDTALLRLNKALKIAKSKIRKNSVESLF